MSCSSWWCRAAGIRVPSRFVRTAGVDLVAAANTVVPAIVALEAHGFTVTH